MKNILVRRFPGALSVLISMMVFAQATWALPFRSQEFAVASPSPFSAAVANEIAKAGGNTFDQTVAIALAMAVTHPYYAALGGGGFAVIRKQVSPTEATTDVIDFREVAPKATTRETFIGKDAKTATDGGLASGVPGVPMGLFEIHRKFGKLPWKKLFAPAIRLAESGFPVSGEWVSQTDSQFDAFNPAGRLVFGKQATLNRKVMLVQLKPGDILKQPLLAKALRLIRDKGVKEFYSGSIAKDIIETNKQTGGVMTMDDLRSYSVVWRKPITRTWRGYTLSLMPPPSSGGLIIAQGLELLDRIEAKHGVGAPMSAKEAHLWGEALKLSFAARGMMGDPGTGNSMNELADKLLQPERLDRLAALTSKEDAIEVKSTRSKDLKEILEQTPSAQAKNEKTETTHFSVADRDGNAVAFTVTLNGSYGSSVVTEKYGIAMNDEMDDFATSPGQPNQYGLIQGEANAVGAGKRPLSSMSPTIIEKDGKFVATLGAPGGPRIASAVYQAIVRLLSQNADAEFAVNAPRVHHQFLPDTLFYDASRFSPDVISILKKYGHKTQETWVAKVYVVKATKDGLLEAASDPRGEAAAGGR